MSHRFNPAPVVSSRTFQAALFISGAALFALPALAQTGPTLKSLVATHGSITAGDLVFSNFQTPQAMPFVMYGAAATNDGSDVMVTPITTAAGRMGLQFTAINPSTGALQPFGVDVAPGSASGGGKNGGGGGVALPGGLTRVALFDVSVANPQKLLANVDGSFGPGTATFAGGGVFTFDAGAANITYYLDPVTATPGILIDDQYFSSQEAKFASGGFNTLTGPANLPGGYLRSFHFGNELFMGGNKRWGGISSGICMVDYYTFTFATVPVDTAPPVVDVKPQFIWVQPVTGGAPTPGSVLLTQPAQAGGATISLTSGNPGLLSLPTTIFVPQGSTTGVFSASTVSVGAQTTVDVSATLNGASVASVAYVYAAPALALSYAQIPPISTAAPVQGTVVLNTVTLSSLVTVTLASNNPSVIVPPSVVIPLGSSSATFPVTVGPIADLSQLANTVITATFGGTSVTAAATPVPPAANFATAEYWTKSKKLNLQATIVQLNQSMTYGTNPNGPALGSLGLSGGPYSFKITTGLATAPSLAVIWIGSGGMMSKPITLVNK